MRHICAATAGGKAASYHCSEGRGSCCGLPIARPPRREAAPAEALAVGDWCGLCMDVVTRGALYRRWP